MFNRLFTQLRGSSEQDRNEAFTLAARELYIYYQLEHRVRKLSRYPYNNTSIYDSSFSDQKLQHSSHSIDPKRRTATLTTAKNLVNLFECAASETK